MKVKFYLIKGNGHIAHEEELEEEQLLSFLKGSGATKIRYYKNGEMKEIHNPEAVI